MKTFGFPFLWTYLALLSVSANNVSLDEGRMLVSWSYDTADDKLSLQVNATTVGWVGFGFALFAPNNMQDYDVILAGYKDSSGYIYDMYSMGQSPPPLDSSQDYNLTMATEEEGHTILHIERAGNTGDTKDIQFTNDTEVFFVWALHSSLDAINSSLYPFHERRGSSEAKCFIVRISSTQTNETSIEAIPLPKSVEPTSPSVNTQSKVTTSHDTVVLEASMAPMVVGNISMFLATSATISVSDVSRSTSSSLLTSSITNIPKGPGPPASKSGNSAHQSDLNPNSLDVLLPSLSTDSSLGSISQSTTAFPSSPENGNGDEQGNGLTRDAGKDKGFTMVQYGVSLVACCLLGMGCIFRQTIGKYWTVWRGIIKIRIFLRNNPNKCAEVIRQLHDHIKFAPEDANWLKQKLLKELKAVAYLGLQEDLKEMLDSKGLSLEGLNLAIVLHHLTDVPCLAKFLHQNVGNPDVIKSAGLETVHKQLGERLEVIGGITAASIDVSRGWAKELCKKAPSFQALRRLSLCELEMCCKEAARGEMDDVYQLVEYAESHRNQLAVIPRDENVVQQSKDAKAMDKENLKKAKGSVTEAKKMLKDQLEASQEIVSKKLADIINSLDLASDWFSQEKVNLDQLCDQLDQIIEQCYNVVESAESYTSDVEIITKASEGRALCGIYHSKNDAPQPAGLPLLQVPASVTLMNPNSAQETNYIKFSEKGLASEYVEKVTSLSSKVEFCVSGVHGRLAGEVEGERGRQKQAVKSSGTSYTSTSVLHYVRTAKRTFQLKRDQIRLTLTARKDAKSIVQEQNNNERQREGCAREFLNRYGSHYPAGVQTLGGVLFIIADAESKSSTDKKRLSENAVKYLKAQMSAGFLIGPVGIGGGVIGEHSMEEGRSIASHKKSSSEIFTYSKKSMGPPANPATFSKLLSYSSNWALIDRGNPQGYIPVWELIRNLGEDFMEAAQILEGTWCKDESEKEDRWQLRFQEIEVATELNKVEDELRRIKAKHLRSEHDDVTENHWPIVQGGTLIKTQTMMTREKAYDKAVEFIMRNPQLHFCEIIKMGVLGLFRNMLKCWKASENTPLSFRKSISNGGPVLLFSESHFKWKKDIPGRG